MEQPPPEYCLFWMQWLCMPRSDWASWMQAIGSIAAIGGAFLFGERQAAHARKIAEKQFREAREVSEREILEARRLEANKRHLDDRLKTEILQQLFHRARSLCLALEGLDGERNPPPPVQRAIEHLREVEQSFRALPAFELPGVGVALGVLAAPRALQDLGLAAQACLDACVKLAGTRAPVEIPSRTRVEFLRAHEQATGIAKTGIAICESQIALLQEQMPVTD